MTLRVQQMLLVIVGLVLLLGSCLLHVRLDQSREGIPKLQRFMFLPQAEVLKVISLGYHSIVADFLWLQTIQVMGEKKITEEAGHWIYRALDTVTTLDPQFVRAYEAGGLALCTLVVLPDQSNALLEKGMKNNPEVWQFPFYLGINYYFEIGDDKKAGDYIARAARLPGAPEHLAGLAARLYVSAKAPQTAVELLASLYDRTPDGEARQILELRLKQAVVARDTQILGEAIIRYRDRFSGWPRQLDDLVVRGILTALPSDPFGGHYLYDPATQMVRSSSAEEKLIMRGHRRRG